MLLFVVSGTYYSVNLNRLPVCFRESVKVHLMYFFFNTICCLDVFCQKLFFSNYKYECYCIKFCYNSRKKRLKPASEDSH